MPKQKKVYFTKEKVIGSLTSDLECEKDDGTQTKRGGWIGFQTKWAFKTKVAKTSFARIVSQNFHKPNSINTESIHPLHKILVKVLTFKKIFSWTFSLIKTRMRKKDKIKRRCTQPFYTGSLSITREVNSVI